VALRFQVKTVKLEIYISRRDIDWPHFRQYEDWLEGIIMAPSYENYAKKEFFSIRQSG